MSRLLMTDGLCARLAPRHGTHHVQPPVLQSVHIMGELRGLLFEARVVQTFRNPGAAPLEVVYSFPLPWGAVLMGVSVVLGERHLSGAVIEKKLAQSRYEGALADGDAAILLEKNPNQTYTLNLGNLAAQETCTITIRYAQMLAFDQGSLRLAIPTVIAPRFGDPIADGGLAAHQVPEHSLSIEHPFSITVALHEALADSRVASPSHAIRVARADTAHGKALHISLAQSASLDRDFILMLDAIPERSAAVLATDVDKPHRVMAMLAFCPRLPAHRPVPVRVKILIDCSGSMNGDSIEAARGALQAVIAQFEPQDLFSLSRFGDTVAHQAARLWPVSPKSRRAAQQWTDKLAADLGGTDMARALTATFALPATDACDVLMVTDGEIAAIDDTLRIARNAGHRLFIVGIGSSPAASHLHRLAEATGGACDFVAPGEAVMPAVLRMFARLRSPVVTDVVVEWPNGVQPRWCMGPPGSVFDGDTIRVYALFENTPAPGEVRLRARYPDRDDPDTLASATLGTQVQAMDTVSRMAVAARLQHLGIDRAGEVDAILTERAVAYQLLTSRTNFLLVHQRAEADKAGDMPELHKVAQMVPAGWHGIGSVKVDPARLRAGGGVQSPISLNYDYDQPAVWRTPRIQTAEPKFASVETDRLEIPAFLRAQASNTPERPARPRSAKSAPRASPQVATSITPLGLSEWLAGHPRSAWPASCLALGELGLQARILAWLARATHQLVTGRHFEQASVVQAFLFVMALPETRERLSARGVLAEGHRITDARLPDWLDRAARSSTPPIDAQLARAMLTALGPTDADRWPATLAATTGDANLKSPA